MLSRRTFGVAGLALLLPRRAESAPTRVRLGVQSYSLRDRGLAEAVAVMAGLTGAGLSTCELWQGHLEPKLASGASAEVKRGHRDIVRRWRESAPTGPLRALAEEMRRKKIPISSFNYSFKDDFSDTEIDRGFVMARALGVEVLTASAQKKSLPKVAKAAARHKMMVAIHNHSVIAENEFATPEDFERAIAGDEGRFLAINLDIGHFTAANFDSLAFLGKHHRKVVALHIKDRKRNQGPAVPFGEGDAPIKEVLAFLRDRRLTIPANIEYEYRGSDSAAEVARCLDYCRRALAG